MWLLKEKPASPIFILYHLFLNSFRYQCAALGTESGLFTVTCCLCLSTQHIRLTKQVLFNTVFLGQPVCCKFIQIYPERQIKPGTIRCLNFTQMPTILSIFTSLPSYIGLPSFLYSCLFLPIFASLPSYIRLLATCWKKHWRYPHPLLHRPSSNHHTSGEGNWNRAYWSDMWQM